MSHRVGGLGYTHKDAPRSTSSVLPSFMNLSESPDLPEKREVLKESRSTASIIDSHALGGKEAATGMVTPEEPALLLQLKDLEMERTKLDEYSNDLERREELRQKLLRSRLQVASDYIRAVTGQISAANYKQIQQDAATEQAELSARIPTLPLHTSDGQVDDLKNQINKVMQNTQYLYQEIQQKKNQGITNEEKQRIDQQYLQFYESQQVQIDQLNLRISEIFNEQQAQVRSLIEQKSGAIQSVIERMQQVGGAGPPHAVQVVSMPPPEVDGPQAMEVEQAVALVEAPKAPRPEKTKEQKIMEWSHVKTSKRVLPYAEEGPLSAKEARDSYEHLYDFVLDSSNKNVSFAVGGEYKPAGGLVDGRESKFAVMARAMWAWANAQGGIGTAINQVMVSIEDGQLREDKKGNRRVPQWFYMLITTPYTLFGVWPGGINQLLKDIGILTDHVKANGTGQLQEPESTTEQQQQIEQRLADQAAGAFRITKCHLGGSLDESNRSFPTDAPKRKNDGAPKDQVVNLIVDVIRKSLVKYVELMTAVEPDPDERERKVAELQRMVDGGYDLNYKQSSASKPKVINEEAAAAKAQKKAEQEVAAAAKKEETAAARAQKKAEQEVAAAAKKEEAAAAKKAVKEVAAAAKKAEQEVAAAAKQAEQAAKKAEQAAKKDEQEVAAAAKKDEQFTRLTISIFGTSKLPEDTRSYKYFHTHVDQKRAENKETAFYGDWRKFYWSNVFLGKVFFALRSYYEATYNEAVSKGVEEVDEEELKKQYYIGKLYDDAFLAYAEKEFDEPLKAAELFNYWPSGKETVEADINAFKKSLLGRLNGPNAATKRGRDDGADGQDGTVPPNPDENPAPAPQNQSTPMDTEREESSLPYGISLPFLLAAHRVYFVDAKFNKTALAGGSSGSSSSGEDTQEENGPEWETIERILVAIDDPNVKNWISANAPAAAPKVTKAPPTNAMQTFLETRPDIQLTDLQTSVLNKLYVLYHPKSGPRVKYGDLFLDIFTQFVLSTDGAELSRIVALTEDEMKKFLLEDFGSKLELNTLFNQEYMKSLLKKYQNELVLLVQENIRRSNPPPENRKQKTEGGGDGDPVAGDDPVAGADGGSTSTPSAVTPSTQEARSRLFHVLQDSLRPFELDELVQVKAKEAKVQADVKRVQAAANRAKEAEDAKAKARKQKLASGVESLLVAFGVVADSEAAGEIAVSYYALWDARDVQDYTSLWPNDTNRDGYKEKVSAFRDQYYGLRDAVLVSSIKAMRESESNTPFTTNLFADLDTQITKEELVKALEGYANKNEWLVANGELLRAWIGIKETKFAYENGWELRSEKLDKLTPQQRGEKDEADTDNPTIDFSSAYKDVDKARARHRLWQLGWRLLEYFRGNRKLSLLRMKAIADKKDAEFSKEFGYAAFLSRTQDLESKRNDGWTDDMINEYEAAALIWMRKNAADRELYPDPWLYYLNHPTAKASLMGSRGPTKLTDPETRIRKTAGEFLKRLYDMSTSENRPPFKDWKKGATAVVNEDEDYFLKKYRPLSKELPENGGGEEVVRSKIIEDKDVVRGILKSMNVYAALDRSLELGYFETDKMMEQWAEQHSDLLTKDDQPTAIMDEDGMAPEVTAKIQEFNTWIEWASENYVYFDIVTRLLSKDKQLGVIEGNFKKSSKQSKSIATTLNAEKRRAAQKQRNEKIATLMSELKCDENAGKIALSIQDQIYYQNLYDSNVRKVKVGESNGYFETDWFKPSNDALKKALKQALSGYNLRSKNAIFSPSTLMYLFVPAIVMPEYRQMNGLEGDGSGNWVVPEDLIGREDDEDDDDDAEVDEITSAGSGTPSMQDVPKKSSLSSSSSLSSLSHAIHAETGMPARTPTPASQGPSSSPGPQAPQTTEAVISEMDPPLIFRKDKAREMLTKHVEEIITLHDAALRINPAAKFVNVHDCLGSKTQTVEQLIPVFETMLRYRATSLRLKVKEIANRIELARIDDTVRDSVGGLERALGDVLKEFGFPKDVIKKATRNSPGKKGSKYEDRLSRLNKALSNYKLEKRLFDFWNKTAEAVEAGQVGQLPQQFHTPQPYFLPLRVSAPPRVGKSASALLVASLARRCRMAIMYSVAPNKNIPLRDMMSKMDKLGWASKKAALRRVDSKLLQFENHAIDEPTDMFKPTADMKQRIVFYSSDVVKDVQLAGAALAAWRYTSNVVFHMRDEAQQLVGELKNPMKSRIHRTDIPPPIITAYVRYFFGNVFNLNCLISATHFPTLIEQDMWGFIGSINQIARIPRLGVSSTTNKIDSQPVSKLLPSLTPAVRPKVVDGYIGVAHLVTWTQTPGDGATARFLTGGYPPGDDDADAAGASIVSGSSGGSGGSGSDGGSNDPMATDPTNDPMATDPTDPTDPTPAPTPAPNRRTTRQSQPPRNQANTRVETLDQQMAESNAEIGNTERRQTRRSARSAAAASSGPSSSNPSSNPSSASGEARPRSGRAAARAASAAISAEQEEEDEQDAEDNERLRNARKAYKDSEAFLEQARQAILQSDTNKSIDADYKADSDDDYDEDEEELSTSKQSQKDPELVNQDFRNIQSHFKAWLEESTKNYIEYVAIGDKEGQATKDHAQNLDVSSMYFGAVVRTVSGAGMFSYVREIYIPETRTAKKSIALLVYQSVVHNAAEIQSLLSVPNKLDSVFKRRNLTGQYNVNTALFTAGRVAGDVVTALVVTPTAIEAGFFPDAEAAVKKIHSKFNVDKFAVVGYDMLRAGTTLQSFIAPTNDNFDAQLLKLGPRPTEEKKELESKKSALAAFKTANGKIEDGMKDLLEFIATKWPEEDSRPSIYELQTKHETMKMTFNRGIGDFYYESAEKMGEENNAFLSSLQVGSVTDMGDLKEALFYIAQRLDVISDLKTEADANKNNFGNTIVCVPNYVALASSRKESLDAKLQLIGRCFADLRLPPGVKPPSTELWKIQVLSSARTVQRMQIYSEMEEVLADAGSTGEVAQQQTRPVYRVLRKAFVKHWIEEREQSGTDKKVDYKPGTVSVRRVPMLNLIGLTEDTAEKEVKEALKRRKDADEKRRKQEAEKEAEKEASSALSTPNTASTGDDEP